MSGNTPNPVTGRFKYRKLRIAFSAICGIICLLLIALWVRSYWWADHVVMEPLDAQVLSWCGVIAVGKIDEFTEGLGVWFATNPRSQMRGFEITFRESITCFNYVNGKLMAPHWSAAAGAATLAIIAWLRWRFSVRTLLIGMTLAAAILGAVVWAVK